VKKNKPKHHLVNPTFLPYFCPELVQKAWGTEQIICRSPHACKIMTVNPGYQVSLHLHKNKTETFILIEGTLTVEAIKQDGVQYKTELWQPYSSITLPAMTPHTFYCSDKQTGPTVFIEASTCDESTDNYRIYPSGKRTKVIDSRRSTS